LAINPKFVKLLTAIRDATAHGRVTWSETLDEDTFRVILDRAVVRIGREYDEYANSIHVVARLADKTGVVLDEISTANIEDDEVLSLLRAVYDMARSRVLKVDELLDSLISEVETREP